MSRILALLLVGRTTLASSRHVQGKEANPSDNRKVGIPAQKNGVDVKGANEGNLPSILLTARATSTAESRRGLFRCANPIYAEPGVFSTRPHICPAKVAGLPFICGIVTYFID
ncbi:hypothetical protein C8R43DRAFT_1139381 [Mycena crocata]|nr:hypothetical protein C8R43DRAFT_1139381 [Mycena crocata]